MTVFPTYQPISATSILIFGNYTFFFFSFIAMIFMMLAGGTIKGIYGGLFFNLLMLLLAYFMNTTYGWTQDYLLMVLMELFLIVIWILSIAKMG